MPSALHDITLQLPRDMFHHVVHSLRAEVPPLSDSPDDIRRRDHYLISQLAALAPANGDEANLAELYIAASAAALQSLRAARAHPADSEPARKLNASADKMLRQARANRSLLQRVQADRRKREADPATRDKDAWNEHCIIGLIADALGMIPPAPMEPPAPEPEPQPEAEPPRTPPFEHLSEAEQYALIYPRRAEEIRRLGRLPQPCTYGPPEPEIVQAIVTGDSPVLRALDLERESLAA